MNYRFNRPLRPTQQSNQSALDNQLVEVCKRSSTKRLRELLSQGASPEAMTKSGVNIGHWAARWGSVNVLEALLDGGLDIHLRLPEDLNRNQMIHEAAQGGHADVCEFLISRGAQADSKNAAGITPLYVCTRNGAMSAPSSALLKTAEKLIELGADVNAACGTGLLSGGNSALSSAAYNEFIPMFSLLLKNGADVDENSKNMKNLRKIIAHSSQIHRGNFNAMIASSQASRAIEGLLGTRKEACPSI